MSARTRGRSSNRWERVTVRMPEDMIDALEQGVEGGQYPSVSEGIRQAIRQQEVTARAD